MINMLTTPHPRITAFIAASIDGKIALKKRKVPDWTSIEDWRFFQESLLHFDAVIVGRNTYHTAAQNLRRRRTYVFSRRIKRCYTRGGVTFINPERIDIRTILREHTRVALLGGSAIYGYFLKKNLIDELYLTIEPLLFGRGIPLLTLARRIPIRRYILHSAKRLNTTGTLLLHYKNTNL